LQEIGEKKAREIRLDSEGKIEMDIWDKKFYGGTEHLKDVFRAPHEDFGDFVNLLKKRNAKRVLDLGCGTGRHTIALVKEGFEVYGIDISRNALAVCQQRVKEKNLSANIILGDMYQTLPYKENFFDGLISTNVLHHNKVAEIKGLIREIERILKPGALIMVEVPRQVGEMRDFEIEPGTVAPEGGSEQGIPHHIFKDERELRNFFPAFGIIQVIPEEKKNKLKISYHFLMFATLKKK
jgi:ubiquinone/menaquinone biosynthesis C-methylase UbiE